VGVTARHHTFFEMLGNFSFGDYFKDQAISLAWNFLTCELKLPADRLYVTVHTSDDQAFEIWNKKIGIDATHLFRKGDKDNFWEMGDVGPCGPCSEIFYDHGEEYSTPNLSIKPGGDILDDEQRYVEIWNLVFMQYEKSKEGRTPLPSPSIDTGAGLERIAAIMQGKYWNYDSDLFTPILDELATISGRQYDDSRYSTHFRVVADHIRSSTMLITDGVIPSNEGRGYVLRRIIRRAIRHLRELGTPPLSFCRLVPVTLKTLGAQYPDNLNNQSLATKLLEQEEQRFLITLDQGMRFLDEVVESEVKDSVLNGAAAFKLYDTFGFPIDLTATILQERNISVDMQGFEQTMQARKEESKRSWKGGVGVDNSIFFNLLSKMGATQFVGYQQEECLATLLHLEPIGENEFGLIFDQTPFYGESGGQAGDSGEIYLPEHTAKALTTITSTKKPIPELHLHLTSSAESLIIGNRYLLKVNQQQRRQTRQNHSATHLLQSALINVLGDHVKQSGSSVNQEKLRFDFTHLQGITPQELQEIEQLVNDQIERGLPISTSVMTPDEAKKSGALALFGEKYGAKVRVVKMGAFSTELCGGTHTTNSAEIGHFLLLSESSLSSGIRRIEALTGATAISRLRTRSQTLHRVEQHLNANESSVFQRVTSLVNEQKLQQKDLSILKEKIEQLSSDSLFDAPEILTGDLPFKAIEVSAESDLKKVSDLFMDRFPDGVILISSVRKNRTAVLLRSSSNKSAPNCSKILKESLPLINGRGGGKPNMAQGSGDEMAIGPVVDKVRQMLVQGAE
ncbi:MAG: alanine--tRNA ligase, partial [Bdellovibrionales bacterium]|nr:alanine--tRNA ligase [Bdellovibrionales bacterium]